MEKYKNALHKKKWSFPLKTSETEKNSQRTYEREK